MPSGGLPAVIAAAARRRMSEFSPQNLSNLVWSFVYMHHADEALLAAAARMVAGRVAEFKPQELANIVWAFASLGYRDEQMVRGKGVTVERQSKENGNSRLRAWGNGGGAAYGAAVACIRPGQGMSALHTNRVCRAMSCGPSQAWVTVTSGW